jgi:hypothetical protein
MGRPIRGRFHWKDQPRPLRYLDQRQRHPEQLKMARNSGPQRLQGQAVAQCPLGRQRRPQMQDFRLDWQRVGLKLGWVVLLPSRANIVIQIFGHPNPTRHADCCRSTYNLGP